MSVEHVQEWLSAYLDEELDAEDRAEVQAHLVNCVDCRQQLDDLRALDGWARALPPPALPSEGVELATRVRARLLSDKAARRGQAGRWLAVAATLAAIAVVPWLVVQRAPSPAAVPVARTDDLVTPAAAAPEGSRAEAPPAPARDPAVASTVPREKDQEQQRQKDNRSHDAAAEKKTDRLRARELGGTAADEAPAPAPAPPPPPPPATLPLEAPADVDQERANEPRLKEEPSRTAMAARGAPGARRAEADKARPGPAPITSADDAPTGDSAARTNGAAAGSSELRGLGYVGVGRREGTEEELFAELTKRVAHDASEAVRLRQDWAAFLMRFPRSAHASRARFGLLEAGAALYRFGRRPEDLVALRRAVEAHNRTAAPAEVKAAQELLDSAIAH
jgi:hypothetical protein